jgi:hypothetical protein
MPVVTAQVGLFDLTMSQPIVLLCYLFIACYFVKTLIVDQRE